MFKKINTTKQQLKLEDSFIKKSEKTKFGCPGISGIYRHKKNGMDYLIKRAQALAPDQEPKNTVKIRTWDEILAAKFFKYAGILVPDMFAVEDNAGWLYVASTLIPNVKNCTKDIFKRLPQTSKQRIYTSLIMHAWLGNRELVNVMGEHFVVDRNNRVFHVGLGTALYSGFQDIVPAQDTINFTENTIQPFLLESHNHAFGIMTNMEKENIVSNNRATTSDFFSEFLSSSQLQRECHLQGALKLAQFSNQHIEALVHATGHTEEDKHLRISVLKARKAALIQHLQKKYGEHALIEEQLAIELQRIFHKRGIYNQFTTNRATDAVVSFKALFNNALKPEITINNDKLIVIHSERVTEIASIIGHLAQSKIIQRDSTITVNISIEEFRAAIHKELIENVLQVFFSSFGYKTKEMSLFHHPVYKGDGHEGFRPELCTDANQITLTLPEACDYQNITQQISDAFHLDNEFIQVKNGVLCLSHIALEQLANCVRENLGVRKTAVVSENKEGKILAGRLSLQKKGVTGFATAGGNSDYPYNPLRAAREEGADEFGYSIHENSPFIPIGSTLPNQKKNIFLIPAGGTSEHHDKLISYQEFQDCTIKYYSFSDFRENYKKHKITFDRSSVDVYLRYYEREIQKTLHLLGIENLLIHIAKTPQSLGKMVLKPSIDGHDFSSGKIIPINKKNILLIEELLGKKYTLTNLKDNQEKSSKGKDGILKRKCIKLHAELNPAQFYNMLQQKLKANRSALVALSKATDSSEGSFERLRAPLIQIESSTDWLSIPMKPLLQHK